MMRPLSFYLEAAPAFEVCLYFSSSFQLVPGLKYTETGLKYGTAGVYMVNGKIMVGAKSTVIFEYNLVHENGGGGGALFIKNGTLNKDACMRFSHNSVGSY